MHRVLLLLPLLVSSIYSVPTPVFYNTPNLITGDGFPVESHTVQTEDLYILTLFRIPYSPTLQNQATPNKPVVYLQHGLLSSSDCWILNGRENSLAYILSNAGYDVWLGNFRGNTYSKKHANLSPAMPKFWDFSWNEMAIYDIPAMVDYILSVTGQQKVHYVGHSQGTTTFLALNSVDPTYGQKFATSHMLAPVGYMSNMQSPLAKVGGPLLGNSNLFSELFGSHEFMPNSKLMALLGEPACHDHSPVQEVCSNVLFLICGWDSENLNTTLLPKVTATHPAGASTSQIEHYLQEYESGYFRDFDYGRRSNLRTYDYNAPPEYEVNQIATEIHFYYADNDFFAAIPDVLKLLSEIQSPKVVYNVPIEKYNHLDFLWAINVKEIINDRVLAAMNAYEVALGHL